MAAEGVTVVVGAPGTGMVAWARRGAGGGAAKGGRGGRSGEGIFGAVRDMIDEVSKGD